MKYQHDEPLPAKEPKMGQDRIYQGEEYIIK